MASRRARALLALLALLLACASRVAADAASARLGSEEKPTPTLADDIAKHKAEHKAEHEAEHKAKRAHHGHGKAPEESPDASDASAAKPVTDVIADAAAKIEEHGDANIAHHAKELEAHSEANAEALSHSNPHEEGSLADDIHKHKEKRRIEELARAGVADGAVDAYDDDDDDEPAAASAADDERPAASEEKVEKVVAPDGDATAPVDLSRGWKDQRVAAGVDAEENFSDRGGGGGGFFDKVKSFFGFGPPRIVEEDPDGVFDPNAKYSLTTEALASDVSRRVQTFSVGLDPDVEETAAEWFQSLGYRTMSGDEQFAHKPSISTLGFVTPASAPSIFKDFEMAKAYCETPDGDDKSLGRFGKDFDFANWIPVATWTKKLAGSYPDAKFLLFETPPEIWFGRISRRAQAAEERALECGCDARDDRESWTISDECGDDVSGNHYCNAYPCVWEKTFGSASPLLHKARWIEKYDEHVKGVKEAFKQPFIGEDRLLVIQESSIRNLARHPPAKTATKLVTFLGMNEEDPESFGLRHPFEPRLAQKSNDHPWRTGFILLCVAGLGVAALASPNALSAGVARVRDAFNGGGGGGYDGGGGGNRAFEAPHRKNTYGGYD